MRPVLRFLRDNSLSLTFLSLFLLALTAQSFSGFDQYNRQLADYRFLPVGYWQYLHTGNFLDAVFSNWQAAILQLGCLIYFGAVLHQKGAPHSRKLAERRMKRRRRAEAARASWLYRNSLAMAFLLLFITSFAGHVVFGARAFNEQRALLHQTAISAGEYTLTSAFWFANTQTWQAEFIGIGIYIVLSIFLRQQGSPESKPVEARNSTTGESNK
jgi:Domain of unknown function (DUF6766)